MGMSSGGKKTGAKPDINITPLIDVLLVMIIIFMVIKHKDPHQFESKVPEKPKQDTPARRHSSAAGVELGSERHDALKLPRAHARRPEDRTEGGD
jgi:biopolymer transport protein ExbD